ncbi:FAD-dependent oxidoreductase [Parasutterella excrementihominis]|uniref:FAD-dependent oxidoreductase n=1 Tax=Parasutterella excrementihominis TaxID=487175 RepID=UPI003AEF750B
MSRLNKLSLCLLLSALPAVSVTAADIEKLNTDVVVVGGGGTGMSAAASAHQHGAKVILLEKLAFVGGGGKLGFVRGRLSSR